MTLHELIKPDAIVPALKVQSKKQAFHELSERAALVSGVAARSIFDCVLQRERLGSTGIGSGIAIPHGKLDSVSHIFGIFGRFERPIDFEAIDGAPVDLVFMLIAPEAAGADHLKALARIARLLRDPGLTAKLRASRDVASLYGLLTQQSASNAA
jgi:PTS system nitrogen regulatory IIA component